MLLDLTLTDDPQTPESMDQRPIHPYAASPVRRAAIDLLGRGFTLWEPYLDTAQLLSSLLALAAEADNQLSG